MSTCASTSTYPVVLEVIDPAYAPHLPEAGGRDRIAAADNPLVEKWRQAALA